MKWKLKFGLLVPIQENLSSSYIYCFSKINGRYNDLVEIQKCTSIDEKY